MSNISTNLDTAERVGVMPNVSPTVPIAEKVSNMPICIEIPSVILIIIADSIEKKTYINKMADAFFTVLSSILLP